MIADTIPPTERACLTLLPPPTSAAIAEQAAELAGALLLFAASPQRHDLRSQAREETLVLRSILADAGRHEEAYAALVIAGTLRHRKETARWIEEALAWAKSIAAAADDVARATEPPGGT